MRQLILAAAAAAMLAAPGLALAKNYDCTKPGNANKAQCKAAAVPAKTATLAGQPAAAVTASAPTKLGGKPATSMVKTATTASGGTMKACAAQWDALSDTQKAAYKTQAAGMKSKKGGKLSGYNVFTGECMKKK